MNHITLDQKTKGNRTKKLIIHQSWFVKILACWVVINEMTIAFHQKWQVMGLSLGISFSKRPLKVRLSIVVSQRFYKNRSFVYWVWPFVCVRVSRVWEYEYTQLWAKLGIQLSQLFLYVDLICYDWSNITFTYKST